MAKTILETEEDKRKRLADEALETPVPTANVDPNKPAPTEYSGFVTAGNRLLQVAPDGSTSTNFAVQPATTPVTPLTPAPVTPITPPPPPPPRPNITALTTNAQMEDMAKTATYMGEKYTDAEKAMYMKMALQARESGRRGADGQAWLAQQGVLAPTGQMIGETNQLARVRELSAPAKADKYVQERTLGAKENETPLLRKVGTADYERAYGILSQERERAYADQVSQFRYDTEAAKLGVEQNRITEIQGKIKLHAQELADKKLAAAFKLKDRSVETAKRDAELSKATTEAQAEAIKLRFARAEEAQAEQVGLLPSTVKAEEIQSAPSIDKVKLTWDDAATLAVRFGLSDTVRNGVFLGVLASSYRSPMELVKDFSNVKDFPADVIGVKSSDVAKHLPDIKEAFLANIPPDQAGEKLLAESGKQPGDKGYNQLALNIAAGLDSYYKEMGNAEKANAAAQIAQSNAASKQATMIAVQDKLPSLATEAGMRAMVSSTMAKVNALSGIREAGGLGKGLATTGIQGSLGLGAPEQYAAMTDGEIRTMILSNVMGDVPKGSAQAQYITDQMSRPDTELSRLLTLGVQEARKGLSEMQLKDAKDREAQEKKYEKDQKVADENGFIVEHDPVTQAPVYFTTAAGAEAWRREPTVEGKKALADSAAGLTKARLADPGYRVYIGMSHEKRSEVQENIRKAQTEFILYDGKIPQESLEQFKELGLSKNSDLKQKNGKPATGKDGKPIPSATELREFPEIVNAYSQRYGLGPVFARIPDTLDGWVLIEDQGGMGAEQKVKLNAQAVQTMKDLLENVNLSNADRSAIQQKLNPGAMNSTSTSTSEVKASSEGAVSGRRGPVKGKYSLLTPNEGSISKETPKDGWTVKKAMADQKAAEIASKEASVKAKEDAKNKAIADKKAKKKADYDAYIQRTQGRPARQ